MWAGQMFLFLDEKREGARPPEKEARVYWGREMKKGGRAGKDGFLRKTRCEGSKSHN